MNTDRPELGTPDQPLQPIQPGTQQVSQTTLGQVQGQGQGQGQQLTTPTEPPLHNYGNYFRYGQRAPATLSHAVPSASPYRNYSMTRYSTSPYVLNQPLSQPLVAASSGSGMLPQPGYYHDNTLGYGLEQKEGGMGSPDAGKPSSPNAEFRIAPMRNSKAKFTADDDELLIELKENQKYSWKRIAQHFPGRTPGALQVRYCTKLRKKSQNWTSDDLKDLTKAVQDYHNEKWHIVAQKMDNKFTSNACREQYELLTNARWN